MSRLSVERCGEWLVDPDLGWRAGGEWSPSREPLGIPLEGLVENALPSSEDCADAAEVNIGRRYAYPEYVVLGETHGYNIDQITHAIRLLAGGAHFIATNPDASGPSEKGIEPACGAMAALMEKASGVTPFFIGKPNPLMMRTALNYLGVHSENAVMIGDRMDTDIIGGIEAGMETVLVLSGVTRAADIARFSYQPTRVVDSVASLRKLEGAPKGCGDGFESRQSGLLVPLLAPLVRADGHVERLECSSHKRP